MGFFYLSFKALLMSNHQAIEEGVVALQGLAEIFSRYFYTLIPLGFQRAMLVGKHSCDLLDRLRYQPIRLLDSRARFIHKRALDLIPARTKML